MVGSHTASASRGDALNVTARVPNDVPRAKYGACHLKRQTGYCSVFEILKYDDAYIEVLETHCGLDRYSLFRKEGEYIRNNKDKVVNIAGAKRRRVKQ
jgi:hypothetical protein